MTTPVTIPSAKVSLPEYHGLDTEEWSRFIGSFRIETLRNPTAYPTDGEKVAMAMSLFRGDALLWLNTKTDVELQTFLGSWHVFATNVRSQFGLSDNLLKQVARTTLESLPYNSKDPVAFFATARTHLAMMGINANPSMTMAVWAKIPAKAKEILVARDEYAPSWDTLREVCIATSTLHPPSKGGNKPKCAHCGKRHNGACQSKN